MNNETQNNNPPKTIPPAVFVGQVLFLETQSYHLGTYVTEHTVTKVSRKHFECEGLRGKFNIENLAQEDGHPQWGSKLYRSKQEIHDKNEFADLVRKIGNIFRNHPSSKNLTIDQLRQVADIVGCR